MTDQRNVRQIFIAGAATGAWWNLGDEAIFAAMLDDLRIKFPNALIGVLSANPPGSLRRYGVQEVPYNEISQVINFAKASDVLIMGGGGFFFDYWGFNTENLFTNHHTGSGVYIDYTLLATLLKKPLVFFAVGVGPLSSEVGSRFTRLAFEQASLITVRDIESSNLLVELGIPSEKIHITADPAFRYKEVSETLGAEIINNLSPGFLASPVIGVAIRDWNVNANLLSTQSAIAQGLDKFVEEYGGRVIFIPFHRDTGDEGTDDFQASQKIVAQMRHRDAAILIDPEYNLEENISIIRNCDLVLGMRLHANIFAVRYGIPCIGLAYDPKVKNFFNSINGSEYCVELSTLTPESLWAKIKKAYDTRELVRREYQEIQRKKSNLGEKTLSLLSATIDRFQFERPAAATQADHLIQSLLLEHAVRSSAKQEEIDDLISQMSALNNQLELMKRSFSWKITRPVRLIPRLIRSPKQTLLDLARYAWKSIPISLRNKIKPYLLRFTGRVVAITQRAKGLTPDLTWEQFQTQVLAERHRYRGIFIQEPVIDWNVPLYQRPQHIAAALGRLGYLVIFKNPSFDTIHGVRQVSENVWATNLPVEDVHDAVYSVYSTAYATADVILSTGTAKKGTFVYEYIDHISAMISGDNENVRKLVRLKKFAFKNADFIVASARQLEQEAIQSVGRDKVLYIPNGVDVQHYRNPAHKEVLLPQNLVALRERYSTLVGYFGAIAPWLWYSMLDELVKLRPDVGFVFIGPDYQGGVAHLPKAENVLNLGWVDYKALPAYGRMFDVCMIPFAPGDIARTTSPLKLFEYFALEKPVVVTSFMDECIAYKEVFSGNSAQSISAAINAALQAGDDPQFKRRLALLADANKWDERAKEFEKVFPRPAHVLDNENIKFQLADVQSLIKNCYQDDGINNAYYETAYSRQEFYYWQPVIKWIADLPPINSLIDIGAAYGTLLIFTALNKDAKVLHAVDPVGYMSKSLLEKFGIVLHTMDFEREAFERDIKFDLVIFTEVIEHLNFQPDAALQKIRQLMHQDSHLIISTPDAAEWGRTTRYYARQEDIPQFRGQTTPWVDDHIWQYTKEELEGIFARNGLKIEKFEYAPGVSKRHLCYLLKLS